MGKKDGTPNVLKPTYKVYVTAEITQLDPIAWEGGGA